MKLTFERASWLCRGGSGGGFRVPPRDSKASAVRRVDVPWPLCPSRFSLFLSLWTTSCSLSWLATSAAMRHLDARALAGRTRFKSNYDRQSRLHLICFRWWIDLSTLITVARLGGPTGTWGTPPVAFPHHRHLEAAAAQPPRREMLLTSSHPSSVKTSPK